MNFKNAGAIVLGSTLATTSIVSANEPWAAPEDQKNHLRETLNETSSWVRGVLEEWVSNNWIDLGDGSFMLTPKGSNFDNAWNLVSRNWEVLKKNPQISKLLDENEQLNAILSNLQHRIVTLKELVSMATEESDDLFDDFLKWRWLANRHKLDIELLEDVIKSLEADVNQFSEHFVESYHKKLALEGNIKDLWEQINQLNAIIEFLKAKLKEAING